MTGDIPDYEYALYEGASQWRAQEPAEVLAVLGEPDFQRTAEHYTSHRQSPFHHATDYAVLARSGRVGLAGFPLGISYYNEGYWIYRRAFEELLQRILPARLVSTNAPLSTEISLTHQAASAERKERYLIHIVNFSALRRTPQHPDFYEDPIPLTDITVRLHLPVSRVQARALVSGAPVQARKAAAGGWEVTLPRIPVSEIVAFEVG